MIYSDFMNGRFRRIYLSDAVNLTFKVSANTSNETCDKLSLKSHSIAVGLFLSVFILFAILGNILVILSVLCHRHLQSVTNIFIVNLAVADLLLSVIVLPFSASSEVLGCWIFGRYFCNIWAALDVLCCTASILSLCVISIDRYIGVKYSFKYPTIMTEKKARIILVLLWVLSVVVSVGPLLGWKEPPPLHDSICNITEDPGYALFSSIFSFYFPLTIILVMYFRIYVVAKRTTKCLEAGMKREGNKSMEVLLRIHCRSVPRPAVPNGQTPFRNSLSVRFLKFSKEKKAAKTLAVVVGVFILCWLPFFFVLPLGSLFPSLKPSEMVFKVIFWLGYFNSCVNPIIYPCSSKEFKRAFIQLLRCQRCPRSRACRTLGDQRWRASMSRSDGGAFSITFSTPESASWRDSLIRKDADGAFCLQGWRFLSPLQSSSSQLREKVHSLSKKVKRGHRRSWTQTLSGAGFDSVPMGIFSGPESCDVHDVAQYRVLKETDI